MPCRTPLTYTPNSGPSKHPYLSLCPLPFVGWTISNDLPGNALPCANWPVNQGELIKSHLSTPITFNTPLHVTIPLNVFGPFPTLSAFLLLTPLVILDEFLTVTPFFVQSPVKLLTPITLITPKWFDIPFTSRLGATGIPKGGPIITPAVGTGTPKPNQHGPLATSVPGITFGTPGIWEQSKGPTVSLSPQVIIDAVTAMLC